MDRTFDVIVVGGGLNGLCTAWWLLRRGVKRVAVLEQFALGHDRGSSHGASRITRSAYADAAYVRLMQLCHAEAWPQLEADAGVRLVHRRDGCFFGDPAGLFGDYLRAVEGIDVDVELVDAAEGRRRFPAFRFPGQTAVLHDRTAGVVAARDTMAALSGLVRTGATVIEGVPVRAVGDGRVDTDQGVLRADRIVVTAGAWAGRLLPGVGRLVPVRQTVAYLQIAGDPAALPVWAFRGDTEDDFFYGLPEFQRPGAKVAHHRVVGVADDPDGDVGPPLLEPVLDFVREHLAGPTSLLATERCLYTMAPNEDFVLDFARPSVVVGAGFSGHGFKFGPLIGRILAELALDGRTSVAPFEAERARFAYGNVRI